MNKGAIRSHFKALLNRSDCSDALADTFMDQSIARIQRTLRIPSMEKQNSYTITGSTAFVVLPSDFLEIIDLYYDKTSLSRVPMNEILTFKEANESGTPKFFSREDENLLIYPSPTSGSLKLNYYGQFADMTSDSDENALALSSSDLIIYGMLTYASDYYLDERGPVFEQKYQQFLAEIQEQANDSETAGTVQAMRPMVAYED
jgi:hypothetical protein